MDPFTVTLSRGVSFYEIRAKGMAFSSILVNIAVIVNQSSIGNAMDAIGWHTYLIFAGWDLIQATVVYFVAVETNNRTLEQLTEIFDAPNLRKESTKKHKIFVSNSDNRAVAVDQDSDA